MADFFDKNGFAKLTGAKATGGGGEGGRNTIEFFDSKNQGSNGEVIEENAGFAIDNGFGGTTGIVANDRTAVSHGFDRNNAKIFIVRTKNKGFGGGHKIVFLVVGDFAQKLGGGAS